MSSLTAGPLMGVFAFSIAQGWLELSTNSLVESVQEGSKLPTPLQ